MTTQTPTLAHLIGTVGMASDRYQVQLARFTERLADDAAYAFSWGDEALRASVRAQALIALHAHLSEESDEDDAVRIERVTTYYVRLALAAASRQARSTSPMSNLVEDERRAYLAEIAAWLQRDGGSL